MRVHNFVFILINALIGISFLISQPRGGQNVQSENRDSLQQAYEKEINGWHERRIANLKKPNGWLALIALDWIGEGMNTIDSIGTVTVKDGKLFVEINRNIHATLRGREFISDKIKTDADTSSPDKIEIGSRAFVIIKRGERYAIRMWDADAPTRKDFKEIDRFPVSLRWKIEARWEQYDKPKKVTVPSVVSGYSEESLVPGVAIFTIEGKECRLEPVVDDPLSDYFFIFADKTNGKETYTPGRFLYADPPVNGKIILDFNKAINPPCAFTPYATCPLPPAGNRLDVRIEAGEKKYKEH